MTDMGDSAVDKVLTETIPEPGPTEPTETAAAPTETAAQPTETAAEPTEKYFIGVDVGTSSVRGALVSIEGKVLKRATSPLEIFTPEPDYFQQSSNEIWDGVVKCIREVVDGVSKERIVGIGFDATCSLVILGENGTPLPVSRNGENPEQNVILWMDHRAHKEAKIINQTKHDLLEFVGGQVSLEMEMPKLLWLKKHAYNTTWMKLWRAFDLSDFLTWRATGCDVRSLCTVACKWNYDPTIRRWNRQFLCKIGLGDLNRNQFDVIGTYVCAPGYPVGDGLSDTAADELGLLKGTAVGLSLIDAHAGALGILGCKAEGSAEEYCIECYCKDPLEGRMAMICGTSTCHMSLTLEPIFATGIWGPYKDVILPGYYLNEGGQSAAGMLLDFVTMTHPAYQEISEKLQEGEFIYSYLNNLLEEMADSQKLDDICFLTKDFHVWPDYRGNRAPLAKPTLKGMHCGLTMNVDEGSLAILYLATVQALAYGTRHIIDSLMESRTTEFSTLVFSGSLAKNSLYVKCHSDVCNLPALVPTEQETVLVGAAMLGACAAGVFVTLKDASTAMGGEGLLIEPVAETRVYHERKYQVFLEMVEDQRKYKYIMEDMCVCDLVFGKIESEDDEEEEEYEEEEIEQNSEECDCDCG